MDQRGAKSEETPPPDPHAAIVEVLAELEAAPSKPARPFDVLKGLAMILLPLALCLSVLGWALDSVVWSGSRDYSQTPAAEVFQKVTGFPVPPGVTELRAAGRSGPFGLKHWVWISFRMRPEALDAVLEEAHRVEPSERWKYLGLPSTPMRHVARDQAHVGWVDAEQIPRPEIYWFSSGAPGSLLWSNTLVFDRESERGYIQALGD